MPQRKTRLESQEPFKGPSAAAELEDRLSGLGQFQLQLDCCRLKSPKRLRKELGGYCQEPFILSSYTHGRLRIVPQKLWAAYIAVVQADVNNPCAARDLTRRLEAIKIVCHLDGRDRWNLNKGQLTGAGFPERDNTVVLFPFRFWLELYSHAAWKSYLIETQQHLRVAVSGSPDYVI